MRHTFANAAVGCGLPGHFPAHIRTTCCALAENGIELRLKVIDRVSSSDGVMTPIQGGADGGPRTAQ